MDIRKQLGGKEKEVANCAWTKNKKKLWRAPWVPGCAVQLGLSLLTRCDLVGPPFSSLFLLLFPRDSNHFPFSPFGRLGSYWRAYNVLLEPTVYWQLLRIDLHSMESSTLERNTRINHVRSNGNNEGGGGRLILIKKESWKRIFDHQKYLSIYQAPAVSELPMKSSANPPPRKQKPTHERNQKIKIKAGGGERREKRGKPDCRRRRKW